MNRKLLIIIPVIGAFIGAISIVGILNNWNLVPQPTNRPDEELLEEKLKDLAEVKAFRDRYGEPDVVILAHQAIWQKTEAEITGVPYNGTRAVEPSVILVVDFDYDANVERMEFTCINDSGGLKLTENILEYLEKENCF